MKQKIQIVLMIAMAIAAIRLAWIFYERHEEGVEPAKKQETVPLKPDYYVTPKKLYPYDLRSARQLTKQPVWVKVGYAYPYFPYNSASQRADLAHEAGRLLPLQKLEIKDVVAGVMPEKPAQKQVLAVFEQDGKSYAAPIGTEKEDDYKFYSDDMLFIQDPHELYKHWPADVWREIDMHEAKQGMSELQTDFALGIGLLQPGADDIDRTLNYPNGGKPLMVSFHHDKAIEIKPGTNE
jgi:hypothetical protein